MTSYDDGMRTVILSDDYQAPRSYEEHRAQQQMFATPAGDIAYTDNGTGEVLIVLHGVPTSSWLYRKIIPQLQRDFRVISVDLLGYGSSAKPENDGSNYSAVAEARRIKALLSSLGGEYQLTEAECHGYVQPLQEGSSPALYAFFTHLDDELFSQLAENSQLFDDFRGRSLILWGGKDDVLTTQQIPFLREHWRIRDEDVHIYPDNQHFLVEEIPDEVVAQVRDFLHRGQ